MRGGRRRRRRRKDFDRAYDWQRLGISKNYAGVGGMQDISSGELMASEWKIINKLWDKVAIIVEQNKDDCA